MLLIPFEIYIMILSSRVQYAAGKEGGFFIVAFGDRNRDGKPDIELSRSPLIRVGTVRNPKSNYLFL